MAHDLDLDRISQRSAFGALSSSLMLGFRFLAWINGIGTLIMVAGAMGVLEVELSPWLLRLPLTAFVAGLALCGLGLLWSYLVQTSLFSQLLSGRARRTHWIPLFCAMLAYALSLAAFVMGCWFTVQLTGMVYGSADRGVPFHHFDRSGPPDLSPEPQALLL